MEKLVISLRQEVQIARESGRRFLYESVFILASLQRQREEHLVDCLFGRMPPFTITSILQYWEFGLIFCKFFGIKCFERFKRKLTVLLIYFIILFLNSDLWKSVVSIKLSFDTINEIKAFDITSTKKKALLNYYLWEHKLSFLTSPLYS